MRISNTKREFSSYTQNQTAIKEDSNSSFSLMLENSKNLYLKKESASAPAVALSFINLTQESKEIKTEKIEIDNESLNALRKQLKELEKIDAKGNIELAIAKQFEINQLQMQIDLTQRSAFGYSIDEQGFMGEDFNAAAGIPLDYKIVYKDLGQLYYSNTTDIDGSAPKFIEIDMPKTIGNYFGFFKELIGEVSQSNQMLSAEEIKALPQFNLYAGNRSDGNLITQLDRQTGENLKKFSADFGKLGISTPIDLMELPDIDDLLQKRQNPAWQQYNIIKEDYFQEDKISMSGLFVQFIGGGWGDNIEGEISKQFLQQWRENEAYWDSVLKNTKELPNNYLIHYDTEQRFWDLLNGKISVESHLQELIELGIIRLFGTRIESSLQTL